MYGIRAIILGLVAAASLVQGAEQGGHLNSVYSGSTSTSSAPTAIAMALVTPAPTTALEFDRPDWTSSFGDWTSSFGSWTSDAPDNEPRDAIPTPTTKLVDPILGPFFSSIMSRLRDLERQVTANSTTTTTKPWEISVSVMETHTEWVSLPTISVEDTAIVLVANALPTNTAYLKNAGRIVSSRAANSTNRTATSTSTSRPTGVPPTSGSVANAVAPVMGAVAVFIAGCVLVL